MTELHEAASSNDPRILKSALVESDFDIDAEDWDYGKRTALHIAAANGCAETTRLLLHHGADPRMRMTGGWTPAHCAAEGGHSNVLQVLVEFGCPVHLTDDYGDTPIHIASIYGYHAVKKLLEDAENGKP